MKKKQLSVIMASMLFGLASTAQADYRVEISAVLGEQETETEYNGYFFDADLDSETSSTALGASLYLSAVDTSKGPLSEAAFLAKASDVSIYIERNEVTFVPDGHEDIDIDIDLNALSGQFVIPGNNLIVRAAIGQGEDSDYDIDLLTIGFGGYITDRIALIVDYTTLEYDINSSDDSVESWIISYKQLLEFDNGQSLSIEPYTVLQDYFGDDAAEFGIGLTWYITRSLGLTAGVSGYASEHEYGDYSKGESSIGIEYFINENFRIGGELSSISDEFDGDYGSENDYETTGSGFELNAAVRF